MNVKFQHEQYVETVYFAMIFPREMIERFSLENTYSAMFSRHYDLSMVKHIHFDRNKF